MAARRAANIKIIARTCKLPGEKERTYSFHFDSLGVDYRYIATLHAEQINLGKDSLRELGELRTYCFLSYSVHALELAPTKIEIVQKFFAKDVTLRVS